MASASWSMATEAPAACTPDRPLQRASSRDARRGRWSASSLRRRCRRVPWARCGQPRCPCAPGRAAGSAGRCRHHAPARAASSGPRLRRTRARGCCRGCDLRRCRAEPCAADNGLSRRRQGHGSRVRCKVWGQRWAWSWVGWHRAAVAVEVPARPDDAPMPAHGKAPTGATMRAEGYGLTRSPSAADCISSPPPSPGGWPRCRGSSRPRGAGSRT